MRDEQFQQQESGGRARPPVRATARDHAEILQDSGGVIVSGQLPPPD